MGLFQFELPVSWYTDDEGCDFLLHSPKQIAEERFHWNRIIEGADEHLEGMDATDKEQRADLMRQKAQAQKVLANYDTIAQNRETLLPHATTRKFTITKPSWIDYVASKAEVEELNDETGVVTINDAAWMQALLPKCVTLEEDVPPVVALYLWGKVKAALSPNPARLPFVASSVPSG